MQWVNDERRTPDASEGSSREDKIDVQSGGESGYSAARANESIRSAQLVQSRPVGETAWVRDKLCSHQARRTNLRRKSSGENGTKQFH